jgi:phosphoglycerate dehydrogenase-like enzyme
MSDVFRVAISGDFRKPDGSPTYPDFDLAPLVNSPGVEVEFLQPLTPIRAEQVADFDALILLIHRFAKESIHPNGRLSVVARFGVGYDTVDVEACTAAGSPSSSRPTGCAAGRRFDHHLMLALTGK